MLVSFEVLLFCLFLILSGLWFITAFIAATKKLNKSEVLIILQKYPKRFFFLNILSVLLKRDSYESLLLAANAAQSFLRFLYGLLTAFVVYDVISIAYIWSFLGLLLFFFVFFFIGDYFPKKIGTTFAETSIKISGLPVSLFLTLFSPLILPFIKLSESFVKASGQAEDVKRQMSQEILQIVKEVKLQSRLDAQDKKLLSSVLTFKEKIAREVMVPRIKMYCLPAEMPLKEAAASLENEGYSRIPIYRETMDNIIGVLMLKDIFKIFREAVEEKQTEALNFPISTFKKNVLYIPETKKIASLLQEFRKKQVHFAVVVDEYGGTSGIITIEDILEQIVGEIADEYDEDEYLYKIQSDGSWIVDARMNLLDLEEQLGIKLPQEGEYDTLGGFIFEKAGSIPTKGFTIHQDEFIIEILSSSDRTINTVKIKRA